MTRICLALAFILAAIGGTLKAASAAPDQFDGRYNYFPMRKLLIKNGDIIEAVLPLAKLARDDGYVLDTRMPSPDPNDAILDLTGPKFFATSKRRLDAPEIEVYLYWFDDAPDDSALDTIADQLRQALAPLGPVTVTPAPPGTRPRIPTGYQPPVKP